MLAELLAVKRQLLMIWALKCFMRDVAARVQLHAVDVFNVSGPPPAGHQCIRRRATVFVAEDEAVLKLRVSAAGRSFIPHEHRHIREMPDRVSTRVKNWSVG